MNNGSTTNKLNVEKGKISLQKREFNFGNNNQQKIGSMSGNNIGLKGR